MLSDPPLAVSCDFLLVLAVAVDAWVGEGVGVRNATPAKQIKPIAARPAAARPFIKNLCFISFSSCERREQTRHLRFARSRFGGRNLFGQKPVN